MYGNSNFINIFLILSNLFLSLIFINRYKLRRKYDYTFRILNQLMYEFCISDDQQIILKSIIVKNFIKRIIVNHLYFFIM